MKTRLIDCGIYRETLRRLRTPALVMLILATVFDAFPLLIKIIEEKTDYIASFTDVHPLLYFLCFATPMLLTITAFRFQTKRCDSDFYHALPFTRTTLSLSMLSAVATWCAVVVIGSSAIVGLLCIPFRGGLTFAMVAIEVIASLIACLFMESLTFLAVSLCGNTVSVVFSTLILLFAPGLITGTLQDYIHSRVQILPYSNSSSTLFPFDPILGVLEVELGTVLLSALCLGLGLWIGKRRPSETAGSPTVTPALQIVLRLLLSLMCCLPAIGILLDATFGYRVDISELAFLYLLAVVAYFLYELFTTKKAKNLLKAIPWLGALALLNAACVAAVWLSCHAITSVSPDADDVDSVSLTVLHSSEELEHFSYTNALTFYNTSDNKTLRTEQPVLPVDDEAFHSYALRYNKSDCDKVQLTDDTSKEIVCERLQELCDLLKEKRYNLQGNLKLKGEGREWCVYEVEVTIRKGAVTHHRRLWLFDSELTHLLSEIDKQAALPTYIYSNDIFPII